MDKYSTTSIYKNFYFTL